MPAATTQRASPDAILAIAKKGGRGRLKVFLGAAPGVGKTFAMLSGAHVAKAEGRDVAVGLVETHGRRETEALLAGLELIPRKPVIYINKILSEFDIDKALARKPSLLLLDELAHTNIPGSRHPKRWQDVEELLAAGVDVWTTLNVQHLEGLNDILQRITGVRVRETVPDHVFEDADEIVLVDLPTDELLKRLAEGKVYVPDMADRARKRFFKPENLTALRELALRRAAERIDADLIDHMRAQAIDGPWPAGERILACVGPDSDANSIVRAAKRLADVMDAPWIAVTVEGPSEQLSLSDRRYVDAAMTLARSLGAETATLAASDIAAELLRFSKFENVTQIVLGRSRGGFITELLRRSLPHELLRRADGVAVHVITGSKREARRPSGAALPASANLAIAPLVWSTVAVAGAVGVGHVLTRLTTFPNISMIFLMAVVFSAVTFGIWPAVYASVLSFLAYNLFFIEPLYTFTIARPHELLALFIFLAISVITSTMAGRIREQAQLAVKRMRATRRLYEFSRRLSGVASYDDIPEAAVAEIHTSVGRPAVLLLSVDGELELRAAWPPEEALDTASMTAARWAIEHDEPAGADTATLPAVPWLFLPLKTGRAAFGVVGIGRDEDGATLDTEARTLLDTLAEQTAAALDRASLAREMVAARSATETERVRNTLAGFDLARLPHAACLDPRLGDEPHRLRRQARRQGPQEPPRRHPRRDRRARSNGAQPAGHDAHRCRRAGGSARLGRPARDRAARRRRRPPARRQATHRGAPHPMACRWCVPMPSWSSRRSAMWSPMPLRTRRPKRTSSSTPRRRRRPSSCASPMTAAAFRPSCCRTCSKNSCMRRIRARTPATVARAPASGSPSPRASWRRTAGRSRR